MANTPPIRRIYTQDVINSDGTIDAERLLYPMNQFLEATSSILDGRIEFDENIATQIKKLSFTTSSTYLSAGTFTAIPFTLSISNKPRGVLLLDVSKKDDATAIIKDPVSIQWSQSNDKININFITGLDDSTSYNITVMVV